MAEVFRVPRSKTKRYTRKQLHRLRLKAALEARALAKEQTRLTRRTDRDWEVRYLPMLEGCADLPPTAFGPTPEPETNEGARSPQRLSLSPPTSSGA